MTFSQSCGRMLPQTHFLVALYFHANVRQPCRFRSEQCVCVSVWVCRVVVGGMGMRLGEMQLRDFFVRPWRKSQMFSGLKTKTAWVQRWPTLAPSIDAPSATQKHRGLSFFVSKLCSQNIPNSPGVQSWTCSRPEPHPDGTTASNPPLLLLLLLLLLA